MENYDYILKCINDKLKDQEETLKYYREDSHKKDARIRELEAEIKALKVACSDYAEVVVQFSDECKRKDGANEYLRSKLYGGTKE